MMRTEPQGTPIAWPTVRRTIWGIWVEDTFISNRVRHAIKFHIISYVRPDGTYVARKLEMFSDQGAYASHGHSIAAKGMGCFPQMYPCPNVECDAYTVYTNKSVSGAMRGYGIPQAMFAYESHTDDVCKALGLDPVEYRRKHIMPVGFKDGFSKNENYFDTFNQCMDKAIAYMDYWKRREEFKDQTGPIRKGIGLSCFWYNTGVWPISLEHSSCRMVLNQDGTIQLQVGETEIGQGADTAYAQMAAEVIGVASGSIGEKLYESKIYFMTEDLLAWTVVIVLISVLFEKLFLRLMKAAFDRWEGR